ncbi:MAG: hypothetical protein RUMPE_00801 [Eubacteriales bacterium SKADARSKE-1]|nr:hypothetical protein [Eubacteriales bacterium SKADARSKE-1]
MLSTKQKDSRKGSRTLKIFLGLILTFLLVGLFVIAFLALQDENKGRRSIYPSNELITKLAYSVLLEKEVTVQSDEVNELIAKQIEQKNLKENIKAINVKTQTDSSIANIYMCFEFCGIELGSVVDTEIFLQPNNKIEFNIIKAQIGKLPIPRYVAANILNKILGNKVEAQDTKIFTNSKFQLNEFNTQITLTLNKFEIKDGKFILKFSGGADALKKVLGEKLIGLLSFAKR